MTAAERWHEYEESYMKYGLDMKPVEKRIKKEKPAIIISAKDKFRIVLLTILAGILGVSVIISSAYAAQLKYDINMLISENAVIEGEIQNLNVEIKKETNITTIERKAMEELGMTYPYGSQIVYLGIDKEPGGDFAMVLKEHAYN
ncbi:MAG: cell division protein FtsL [Firmicutes bacterium]|nr:cell division protein FtsL [Bacillota bacterium]MBQ9972903.1 cell division protein FtsL [Bacillota bacterium]